MVELSTKPYLIRAIYEWCADCGYTPYLSVRVDENTRVPMEYVKEGEIVLNVGHGASRNLTISNDIIQFSARFNGVSREIAVPTYTVQGIFARETGKGAFFETEEMPEQFIMGDEKASRPNGDAKADAKPGLRLASVSTLGASDDDGAPPEEGVPQAASNVNSIRTMRSVPASPPTSHPTALPTSQSGVNQTTAGDKSKFPVDRVAKKSLGSQPTPAPQKAITAAPAAASRPHPHSVGAPSLAAKSTEPPMDLPPDDPPPASPAGTDSAGKKSGLRIIK